MPKSILKPAKKILKPLARAISKFLIWIIIFVQYRLLQSKNKNHIAALLASLCFGTSLVFKIDPQSLKYHIENPDVMQEDLFVWAGDWDKNLIPINEHEKFFMMEELFALRKDFKNTKFYAHATSQMEKGIPLKRGTITLDSLENISLYFKKAEKLFEDIKEKGFDLSLAPETGIVIGRNGSIIHFRQGHHTLAIARLLGVKNVIVRVRAVHSLWLSTQVSGRGLFLLSAINNSFRQLAGQKQIKNL